METYLHTTIAEITCNLDIDVRYFNSRIFTTTDIKSIDQKSTTKDGIRYLCICTEFSLAECTVVGDIKVKPHFLFIIGLLSYLTKHTFNPSEFIVTSTKNGGIEKAQEMKFMFNNIDYSNEFEKIVDLLNSNKENKKHLFQKIIERYIRTIYSEKDINSWGATDTF